MHIPKKLTISTNVHLVIREEKNGTRDRNADHVSIAPATYTTQQQAYQYTKIVQDWSSTTSTIRTYYIWSCFWHDLRLMQRKIPGMAEPVIISKSRVSWNYGGF